MSPESDIIRLGKALRVWNGGKMRRRYQTGHLFSRGKRRKVWDGGDLEIHERESGRANPDTIMLYTEADEPGQRLVIEGLGNLIFSKLSHVVTAGGSTAPN